MKCEQRMKSTIRYLVFLILIIPPALAQDVVRVKGQFQADSISIGEAVPTPYRYIIPAPGKSYFRTQPFLLPHLK